MIRRFLTVRWVAIHLMTIAIVVLFIMFGRWQLHRWEDRGSRVVPPDAHPAVALADLVHPDQPLAGGSIGRRTTVSGRFDGAHQVLIADRQLGGRDGFWVVTALRPDAGPIGSAALVVRGWVPSATDPAVRVPGTEVTVSGRLYASEDRPPVGSGPDTPLPTGQFREVNTAELTGAFPYRLLDGYVLLSGTDPTLAGAPTVLPTPVTMRDSGAGLRNLAYAFQWWLFAIAVLYFWGKLVREDLSPSEDRIYQRATPQTPVEARIPEPSAGRPAARSAAADPASDDPESDAEDAELAAYNRYLADLNARSGRRS